MRNTLSKSEIITRPSDFYERVMDPKLEISNIIKVGEGAIRLVYKEKTDHVQEHASSNVVISLWTTSAARLILYDYMKKADSEGSRLLYTDTVVGAIRGAPVYFPPPPPLF